MLPHEEIRIDEFYLLVVEREPEVYRLYMGVDGEHYTHYGTGRFSRLREAVQAAWQGFDPAPLEVSPHAPFSRKMVLEEAPHGFDSLKGNERRGRG